MSSTDIPRHAFIVYNAVLSIKSCSESLKANGLQCSECMTVLFSEEEFAIHVDPCMKSADKGSLNFQVHMHSNRLVMSANRISELIGTTASAPCLVCPLCLQDYESEKYVTLHIKSCFGYQEKLNAFWKVFESVILNLINSHEQLGVIFQKYVIRIHETKITDDVTSDCFNSDPVVYADQVSAHFAQQDKYYREAVDKLTDSIFIRYLHKKKASFYFSKDEEVAGEVSNGEEADEEYSDSDGIE